LAELTPVALLGSEESAGVLLRLDVSDTLCSSMVSFIYTLSIEGLIPKVRVKIKLNFPTGMRRTRESLVMSSKKMFKVVIDMRGIGIHTVTRPYMFSDIF
jgi:hypothetical protein